MNRLGLVGTLAAITIALALYATFGDVGEARGFLLALSALFLAIELAIVFLDVRRNRR